MGVIFGVRGAAGSSAPGRTATRVVALVGFLLCAVGPTPGRASAPSVEQLRNLSIEDLANIQVTSVFKRPEPLSRTPASVYVITREDIRRSGARTLPEALRLAPNLEVAQLNARSYAVSARGFNAFQLSNKLLVLIDGRSIYTPLHAGVFWDQQQVMVDDIERIEVISGPAGTIWGANAVNGVINVITRNAHDTQGGLARLDVGTPNAGGAVRYGGKFGDNGAWRAYGLGSNFGQSLKSNGDGEGDDWENRQGGFRADWGGGENSFNLQGDAFRNPGAGDATNSGGNLTGHWTHNLGPDSSFTLQGYYDQADRDVPGASDRLRTFDIEARHNFRAGRHQLVWGGGYRFVRSEFPITSGIFVVTPSRENISIANLFGEDSIALLSDLTLTLGAKVEYDSLSDTELMPSARLAWQIADDHMLWGAVSRAIRSPSVIDQDLNAAGVLQKADDSFQSEKLIAYELGYRGRPDQRSTLSVTIYYHDYDDLRVLTVSPTTGLLEFGNEQTGFTYGLETWGDYRITQWWRLMAGVNLIHKHLQLGPTATTIALDQHQGNDPSYQLFLRSYLNLTDDLEFDATVRRIDALPRPAIPSYTALDLHLGWQVTERVQLSLVGLNLLDSQHPETGLPTERGEIPRSVYVSTRVKF
jgi:iron complex outermembrane receptor protein